ncbi:MAG: chemotaxis protein CheC [Planctomycetota bacterium]
MRFNADQIDALTEVVNIGVGRAAASLNELLGERIELRVPAVRFCNRSDLRREIGSADEPLDTAVLQKFEGRITGRSMLAFPRRSGVALAALLVGDDPQRQGDDLDFDLAGTLEEVGNIVLNGVLGSIANVFCDDFRYSVPELCQGEVTEAAVGAGSLATPCLLADAVFSVAGAPINGSLLLVFHSGEIDLLLDELLAAAAS